MTLLYKVWRSHGPNNINSSCLIAEVKEQKKKRHGSPKTPSGSPPRLPPPPPPPAGPSGTSGASGAFGFSQLPPPPPPLSNTQGFSLQASMPPGSHKDDEQAYSSSGEDIGRDHIPTVNLRKSWWKPITDGPTCYT
ncbi:hypothetical protein Tco_0265008 [Tanacetum coccineum]